MNIKMLSAARKARPFRRMSSLLAAMAVVAVSGSPAYAEVAQTPLYLGGGNVPGNLTLVPSVEWPTINSVANLGAYSETREYLGYFDPRKCYVYVYNTTESLRHFNPVSFTSDRSCTGTNQWSGNFMNWAATQTIDPFRWVLTGGHRVRDTSSETWLEKARHDGQGGTNIYPNRRLPASGDASALVQGATPASWNFFNTRIQGLGNKMLFTRSGDVNATGAPTAYNPAVALGTSAVYEVSVRVKVCVSGLLEGNCRQYSGGFKPEGLIQQYADELRIGVFGYLNDGNMLRDGGVLRAGQKFVGPNMLVPGAGEAANPNREWDPATGVLIQNPNPADASATATALGISIANSGAINYLNKFGQLTTNNHKNFDPVSELYYTAIRYLKNQGNVPQYTNPATTGVNAATAADGFPVITNWDDPIQYACQTNVILGIGDVYTHRDKNLPGSSFTADEPAKPSLVANDDTVNVVTATASVASMEGITINNNPFSGRNNSAFLAGLAWDSHTRDIRPDLSGTQTVSTHWVDVLEAQSLEPPVRNQYYLATKYGGFRVPEDFDPDTHTGPLSSDWWHSNGDTLVSFGPQANPTGVSFLRPDNYYVAGEANDMVESLTQAFARISAEVRSSASSVAANSTRLGSDTAVFQAAFDSTNWSGDLQAFRINADGTIADTAAWRAAAKLDGLTDANMTTRKIFTSAPPVSASGGALLSSTGLDFVWTDLATVQTDALRKQLGVATLVTTTVGQARLDYLRGVRSQEQPGGTFRKRDSRLGDIVNSDPQFVHKQDFGYALLDQSAAFSGMNLGQSYLAYRQSGTYQTRTPMVVVGSNDGMLHGFDASLGGTGGNEMFAYVPNEAFANLFELTLPEYAHRYFVDGSPRIADAWVGGSWRTIVVATTGAGGRSVFALDITNPSSMSKSNVLWEFKHASLGKTIAQPAVTPLPNGQFGVVVTTGYDTGLPDGVIFILNPQTGAIIRAITLPNSGELGAPLVADLNSDRVADRIYVGDSNGNLWRVDLDGSNTSNWKPPQGLLSGNTPQPLFVARDDNGQRQAITAPLSSAFNEKGQHTIFFGTGSFYRVDDNLVLDDPDVDTFYGIIDLGTPIASRANLLEQEILAEVNASGIRVRGVTDNEMLSSHKGWYLDLVWPAGYGGPGPAGERVVSRASVRGDRVIFATLIPNPDPCAFGGDSWIMELNTFDGGRLDYAVFDLNNDGVFDDDDWITITGPDGTEIRVPPSAMAPDINIVKTPAIIAGVGESNDEVKILSGSSGQLIRITERGGVGVGRQSWRQIR